MQVELREYNCCRLLGVSVKEVKKDLSMTNAMLNGCWKPSHELGAYARLLPVWSLVIAMFPQGRESEATRRTTWDLTGAQIGPCGHWVTGRLENPSLGRMLEKAKLHVTNWRFMQLKQCDISRSLIRLSRPPKRIWIGR